MGSFSRSSMKVLLILLPFLAIISANPVEEEDFLILPNENEQELMPEVEDSKVSDLPAEGRLFFVQAFATQFITTATSTLSTYTSCYSTLNAAPACSSSVLSGRKKRSAMIAEEIPRIVLENGETADFRDYIKASRVARTSSVSKMVTRAPQIFEASISDVPQCLKERALEDRGPSLITVTTTITSSTAATVTQTQAAKQTLKFTSVNAGDCFPMSIIASLNIPAC